MNKEILLSEKFAIKLLTDTLHLKELNHNIIQQYYYFIVDTKYRKMKRLDRYLADCLKYTQEPLINVALSYYNKIPDRAVTAIADEVHSHNQYATDLKIHGMIDKWEDINQAWELGQSDCETANSTIYTICRHAGIPSYLLWCCIGDTGVGGHFWLLYLSPKTGKFYAIDSTAWYDSTGIYKRKEFEFGKGKNYEKIWYIFNETTCFKMR